MHLLVAFNMGAWPGTGFVTCCPLLSRLLATSHGHPCPSFLFKSPRERSIRHFWGEWGGNEVSSTTTACAMYQILAIWLSSLGLPNMTPLMLSSQYLYYFNILSVIHKYIVTCMHSVHIPLRWGHMHLELGPLCLSEHLVYTYIAWHVL